MTPAAWCIAGLAAALAASMAGNVAIGHAYLGKRDEATQLASDRNQQKGAAEACTKSVDGITAAANRQTAVAIALASAAKASAAKHGAKADQILGTPAAVPGDDCASARSRVDRFLSERVNP